MASRSVFSEHRIVRLSVDALLLEGSSDLYSNWSFLMGLLLGVPSMAPSMASRSVDADAADSLASVHGLHAQL